MPYFNRSMTLINFVTDEKKKRFHNVVNERREQNISSTAHLARQLVSKPSLNNCRILTDMCLVLLTMTNWFVCKSADDYECMVLYS